MSIFDNVTETRIVDLRDSLLKFFKGRLHDQHLAEDCAQYALLIGDKHFEKYDEKRGSIEQFLFGRAKIIMLNLTGESGNPAKFSRYIVRELGEEYNPALTQTCKISDKNLEPVRNLVLESNDLEKLFVAIRHELFVRLPKRYSSWEYLELFDMLYLHNLKVNDINKVLKMNKSTLKSRIEKFREVMNKTLRSIENSRDGFWKKEFNLIFD